MSSELLDMLDESIQDLDEAGFSDQAESLYTLGYESTWQNDSQMIRAVGMELMRIQDRIGAELPPDVMKGLTRCMEFVRRAFPSLSLTED